MRRAIWFLLGSRHDWHLHVPSLRLPRPSIAWIGPLVIIASVAISWLAFADASGDGNVAVGLWVGSAAILLMAWSFVLAVRLTPLESFFGGLDSMFRAHRWAAVFAIVFMYLHTSIEPEIEGGIQGAAEDVAKSAEDLAGTGQTMLYILVGLSIVRIVPYRWWRWTHKLLGIPFAFASWHFFTAEKPYANGSAWGWWFGGFMVAGLVAYAARVFVRDTVVNGADYRVVAADHGTSVSRLELEPVGHPLGQQLGQFAFIRLDAPGMSEPHPFTIASGPHRQNLEFFIRHLGDWTSKLPERELLGVEVRVEGPYGRFEPVAHERERTLWIAGGVGITPFLAALDDWPSSDKPAPTLLYAVRSIEGNLIVDRLRAAERERQVDLHLFTSPTRRLGPGVLDELFADGLAGYHVALCGPGSLVQTMAAAAVQRGASAVETEDFDLRQGFGPNRSKEIDDFCRRMVATKRLAPESG